MKHAWIILLTFISTRCFCQLPVSNLKVETFINTAAGFIQVIISSPTDSLNNCNVQIKSGDTFVKMSHLPKSFKKLSAKVLINDLQPGTYDCIIVKENREIARQSFFMDLILIGKMPELNTPETEKK